MAELAHRLRLEVVTPTGQALKTEADAVDLQSVLGEFEVLPGHLPVLVALKAGAFRFRQGPRTHRAAVGEGFAEARPDAVIVLADRYVPVEQIDAAEAAAALAAADEKIRTWAGDYAGPEYGEVMRDHDWAQARVDVAGER